jgi:hypothetical protein
MTLGHPVPLGSSQCDSLSDLIASDDLCQCETLAQVFDWTGVMM